MVIKILYKTILLQLNVLMSVLSLQIEKYGAVYNTKSVSYWMSWMSSIYVDIKLHDDTGDEIYSSEK